MGVMFFRVVVVVVVVVFAFSVWCLSGAHMYIFFSLFRLPVVCFWIVFFAFACSFAFLLFGFVFVCFCLFICLLDVFCFCFFI